LEFSRLRFLTFVFGHEGPMDAPLTTPPVIRREYFVEADVSGIESAASIRFELLDGAGRMLEPLTMWKGTDSSSDGEFYGFITVPNQPFRVAINGTAMNGGALRSLLGVLFQPAASGPADVQTLPPGIPPDQAEQIQGMINAYRQQMRAQAVQAAADHPGGWIAFARTEVSPISYEPLASASGATIGMRLRYTMKFPSRQTIRVIPHVFPVYQDPAWRGVVTMKPLTGSISPAPQMVGVQTMHDVIAYEGAATYQAGMTYTFTIDMVPDYVYQGTQSGRFCIHDQKFTNRPLWAALIASQAAVPYSVTISDTGTVANISSFLPQRTFHEGFIAGGSIDCGPVPNIRF